MEKTNDLTPKVANRLDVKRVAIARRLQKLCRAIDDLPKEICDFEELNQGDALFQMLLNDILSAFASANALNTNIVERLLTAQTQTASPQARAILLEQTRKTAQLGQTLNAFGEYVTKRVKAYNREVDRFLENENRLFSELLNFNNPPANAG